MRHPERKLEPKFEVKNQKDTTDPIDPDREKLKNFLNTVVAELKKEDIPYKDRGEMRIDMYSRENITKEDIEKDGEEARELRKKFHEKLVNKLMERHKLKREEAEQKAKGIEIAGENLEMLKTAIFYKYLRQEFIIARSTNYDDVKRHVDNIILDKKTGNIVCALDETTDLENIREKKEEVSRRNEEHGASLKYGLKYEEEIFKSPGKREIKNIPRVREIPDIPLFYLSIPYELVEGGMSSFETDLEKVSDVEYKLYKSFVELMRDQIKYFPYSGSNQNTRANLSNFSRESFPKFEQVEKTLSNR